MNAITQTGADARTEAINEALYDARRAAVGCPALADKIAEALEHIFEDSEGHYDREMQMIDVVRVQGELAKHGLVIVEAARHDKLLTTLQFVGSYPPRYVPPMIRKAVAVAIIEATGALP